MSTYVNLWEAHRVAALNAYGYADVVARTPNMTAAFARTLIDSWSTIGQKYTNYYVYTDGIAQEIPGPLDAATPYLVSALASLDSDRDAIGDASYAPNAQDIWNHTFSIASALDNGAVAGPSYIESVGDVLTDAKAYVERTAGKAAAAIQAPAKQLFSGILLAIAVGVFVYLEIR